MKQIFLLLWVITSSLFMACTSAPDDGHEDEITGTWFTQGKRSTIKVAAEEDSYYGKITDLKRPLNREGEPKRDFRNPDPDKKTNLLQGTKVLRDVKYKGDKVWEGVFYDYKTGEDHDIKIRLTEKGNLLLESPELKRDMTWRSEYPVGT
ncbi:MAG: DUF2147 domain-containing protein [Bacteroidota bacterium]